MLALKETCGEASLTFILHAKFQEDVGVLCMWKVRLRKRGGDVAGKL